MLPRVQGERAPSAIDSRTVSEAFRLLRTNVEVAVADLERPAIVVTSAVAAEGKTSVCSQLAQAFAFAGRRVIAVDLDLRRPGLHNTFGVDAEPGVSDVLRERCSLESAIRYVPLDLGGSATDTGLYVLPAGQLVTDPPELLSGRRIVRLIDGLSLQADIVLIDAPPVLPVADTLVIGRLGTGALLVVRARETPYTSVVRAKDALVRNHVRILGTFLNHLDPRDLEGGDRVGYGYDSMVVAGEGAALPTD